MSTENNYKIATELKQMISVAQAHHYQIIPEYAEEQALSFKTCAAHTETLQNELQIVFGKEVHLISIHHDDFQKYLSVNYRVNQNKKTNKLSYSDDFLLKIIYEAKEIGSSDIHFEAFEEKCRVRFRIDGKLIERYLVDLKEYPILINRIKIMAQLDISEKRLPQDGRIHINSGNDEFDIRVSVLPTLHGEKIVLRLLSKDSTNIQLETLGFTELELRRFQENIKKPHGMVLISGPTGSGKTTTLYASLKVLNTEFSNIVTIEDPIEYTLEGINQVQLKETIGLDFPNTLRTFLRQDPDIIMVGEIRDADTANMAIRAALTGHTVLSTIHTNSAWATISRLIDMGIPPFLIASTLNMSVAQRLVRKLCKHCKTKHPITPTLLPEFFSIPKHWKTHFKAIGCTLCHHTGYHGRKAIYEIIPFSPELTEMIKSNQLDITQYLIEKNIPTLQTNAIELVSAGVTSIDEIYPLLC